MYLIFKHQIRYHEECSNTLYIISPITSSSNATLRYEKSLTGKLAQLVLLIHLKTLIQNVTTYEEEDKFFFHFTNHKFTNHKFTNHHFA